MSCATSRPFPSLPDPPMQREVGILRRQLREASEQLERHMASSRKGRIASDNDVDWD